MLRHQQNESVASSNNPTADNAPLVVPSATLAISSTSAAVAENDNVYVRELRRMFDSCATSVAGENVLDERGLEKLCNELHLHNHRDYIVGQLIPTPDNRLDFETFKIRFIQLLPEIVEFSTSVDDTGFVVKTDHRNVELSKRNGCQDEIIEDAGLQSDNDTSNDILSEFSDDAGVVAIVEESRPMNGCIPLSNKPSTNNIGTNNVMTNSSTTTISKSPALRTKSGNNNKSVNSCNRRSIDAEEVEQILSELGLADKGYLGRYELRILCQHLGLTGLTPQELTVLFNQLDKDGDGKISVADFLSVCPPNAQSSLATTVNGVPKSPAITPVSSIVATTHHSPVINSHLSQTFNSGQRISNGKMSNASSTFVLFTSLDHSKTGHAKVSDLLQYWLNIGVEDGRHVLKKLGIAENHWINLKSLCDALFSRLDDVVEDDFLLSAIFYTLKAEILYLKETFDESRDQASFYLRELQQVNQRNSLLVEELDQSQQNLEIRSQMQLRELEDKYQGRIATLEAKYKSEREQWHNELRDRDELLHRMQQNEASLQSRLRQTDRENLKLKNEVDDLTQTVNELEDINREIRLALQDVSNSKKNYSNDRSCKLGRSKKASSLNSHTIFNSALHSSSNNRRVLVRNMNGPIATPVIAKRSLRRKLLPNETSDFESDPEPIFMRPKLKRPLKKKQRLALVAHRMPVDRICDDPTASTSSSEEFSYFEDEKNVRSCSSTINGCCSAISTQLTALEKQLSEERKFLAHELRMEVTTLEDEHEREKKRLIDKFETEKRALIANFRNQMDNMNLRHVKDKDDSLNSLETELKAKFTEEKRDMEIRWASERNVAERRFAEDKMAIMERLQNEFQLELKRIQYQSKVSPANSLSDVSASHSLTVGDKQRLDKMLHDKLQLESSLNTLSQELENVRFKLNEELVEKSRLQQHLDECRMDAEEKHKTSQRDYESTNEKLRSEIRTLSDDAQRLLDEIEQLKNNLSAKLVAKRLVCVEVQTDAILKENREENLLFHKSHSKQSLNDQVSSLDSVKIVNDLKCENVDLRERLNASNEHVLELQSLFSVADSQRLRYAIGERRPLEWTSSTESACDADTPSATTMSLTNSGNRCAAAVSVTAECEQLKEENFLLNARLNEQRRLTEELTLQLHEQMKETSKVALVAQNFYGKYCQLEESRGETATNLNEVKEAMAELYVEVAGRLLK